jgi:hypothetical protein
MVAEMPARTLKTLLFVPLTMFTATAALAGSYTLDTPIQTIAARPEGAAVLNRDIPGLLTNSSYDVFKALSLKQVRALSGGRLTKETLAQTEMDLKALDAGAKTQTIAVRSAAN